MAERAPFRGFRGFNTPNNTQVPDELFDELMVHLSGAELKVLLYIIRRTYGFKRESDNISLSQMLTGIVKRDGVRLDHGTGLSKPTLLNALRTLAQKGMIIPERRRSAEHGDQATTYRLHLITDSKSDTTPPPTANDNGEGHPPVVKKFAQGGSKNLATPVGKKLGHAVVKKSASQVTGDNHQENKVVNAETANDLMTTPKRRRSIGNGQVISDRALRATYNLTDDQIGRVHWLVQKQTEILGAADRNHAHYVKRAAEAVRDGDGDFLDRELGDFKQAATEIAVGSRPAYFHSMYVEATQKRGVETKVLPIPEPSPQLPTPSRLHRLGETFRDIVRTAQDHTPDDPRARLIADAEQRGFRVPDYIRTADIQAVNRWWAGLTTGAESQP